MGVFQELRDVFRWRDGTDAVLLHDPRCEICQRNGDQLGTSGAHVAEDLGRDAVDAGIAIENRDKHVRTTENQRHLLEGLKRETADRVETEFLGRLLTASIAGPSDTTTSSPLPPILEPGAQLHQQIGVMPNGEGP